MRVGQLCCGEHPGQGTPLQTTSLPARLGQVVTGPGRLMERTPRDEVAVCWCGDSPVRGTSPVGPLPALETASLCKCLAPRGAMELCLGYVLLLFGNHSHFIEHRLPPKTMSPFKAEVLSSASPIIPTSSFQPQQAPHTGPVGGCSVQLWLGTPGFP